LEVSPAAAPGEVPLLLASFVRGSAPILDEDRAQELLQATGGSDAEAQRWIEHGLDVLNIAIRAYRAGAHDPYVSEVTARDPRRIRIGYGSTEDVGNGAWRMALELPLRQPGRSTRIDRLRPSEAVAMSLAGRGVVLEAEDLLLRTMLDLDNGRTRGAAYQLRAALALLQRELPAAFESLAPRLADVDELVSAAGDRSLSEAEVKRAWDVLDAAQQALDSWRYAAAR
jgi:hypothetical protein